MKPSGNSLFIAASVLLCASWAVAADPAAKPHPRLFSDAAGFESIKTRMSTSELVRLGAGHARKMADMALSRPLPERRITDGRRMLSVSHAVTRDIMNLAMAYRLFGDRRHLEKAESVMCAAAAFDDWNPSHFLDVAVMSLGVAVGYDWLHGDLSAEARELIRSGLVRNGLDAGLAKPRVRTGRTNWAQVCTGGILAAALAVAESEPAKCAAIMADVRRNMPATMRMYLPDGAYPEGPGYWHFGTGYNVVTVAILESATGDDMGLASQPAFRETARYIDMVTGPTGLMFNYSDCSHVRSPSWMTWWFASRFGEPYLVEPFEREAYTRLLNGRNMANLSPLALFWVFPRTADATVRLPLAWRSDGVTDIAVQRSDWTVNARFAAFKGGRGSSPHAHADGGSFVYDAKGVRWAWDLGGENYAKVEHAIGMRLWDRREGSPRFGVYRIGPYSHNTLILDGLPHCVTGDVRVVSLKGGPLSESTLDMTPLFTNATRVIRRGTMLPDGFRISDSVGGLRAGAPIRWAMMTKAQVARDGGDLVLSQDGKTLRLSRSVPPGASGWNVEEAPHGREWESPNRGFRQITFTVPSVPDGVSMDVTFR